MFKPPFPKRVAWAKLIWGFLRNKIRMPREYVHKSPCFYGTLFKISKTIDLSCVCPLHSGLYFVALWARGTGSILEDPIPNKCILVWPFGEGYCKDKNLLKAMCKICFVSIVHRFPAHVSWQYNKLAHQQCTLIQILGTL